jgi:hypothetical protein
VIRVTLAIGLLLLAGLDRAEAAAPRRAHHARAYHPHPRPHGRIPNYKRSYPARVRFAPAPYFGDYFSWRYQGYPSWYTNYLRANAGWLGGYPWGY